MNLAELMEKPMSLAPAFAITCGYIYIEIWSIIQWIFICIEKDSCNPGVLRLTEYEVLLVEESQILLGMISQARCDNSQQYFLPHSTSIKYLFCIELYHFTWLTSTNVCDCNVPDFDGLVVPVLRRRKVLVLSSSMLGSVKVWKRCRPDTISTLESQQLRKYFITAAGDIGYNVLTVLW